MEAEHFGISIVEMLAAGCLVVAHNSAGPKEDIIQQDQHLAITEDEYFEKILSLRKLSPSEQEAVSKNFR